MGSVTIGVSFVVVIHRAARYYEEEASPHSMVHDLWLRSTTYYMAPFPEIQGWSHVVEWIQVLVIRCLGEVLGGIAYLVFCLERVWQMVFGSSESDLLQQQILFQQQELEKLKDVESISAQLLQALQIAVGKSSHLATAVARDILKLTESSSEQQTVRVTLDQELSMIDTVLEALNAKLESLSRNPSCLAKIEQFKHMIRQQIESATQETAAISFVLITNEEVEADYKRATMRLKQSSHRVGSSVDSMIRSLVDILAPDTGEDSENSYSLGGLYAST